MIIAVIFTNPFKSQWKLLFYFLRKQSFDIYSKINIFREVFTLFLTLQQRLWPKMLRKLNPLCNSKTNDSYFSFENRRKIFIIHWRRLTTNKFNLFSFVRWLFFSKFFAHSYAPGRNLRPWAPNNLFFLIIRSPV